MFCFSSSQNPIQSPTKAVTMLEALTVIVILGILLFITLPHLTNTKVTSDDAAAKAKANQINIAKDAYISIVGLDNARNASIANSWASYSGNANSDNLRFQLIRRYLPTPIDTTGNLNSILNETTTAPGYGIPGYFMSFCAKDNSNNNVELSITSPVLLYRDIDLDGTLNINTDTAIAY